MQIQIAGGTGTTGGNAGSPVGYVNAFNERIFRVARNSFTKTATITAASFSRGGPAILATDSVSQKNGFDLIQPLTKGQPVNNMLIGVVYDYPDTTVSRNGVWQPEDVGLVQCYGLHTNVFFGNSTKSDTFAGGLILVPDTGSQFGTIGNPVVELAGTATVATNLSGLSGGLAGLVVLAQSLASAASETRTGVAAFIRCM
jgi:hypothetical protein